MAGRNDLVFTLANSSSYPGYGHFLQRGFTTWPETWDVVHRHGHGASLIHGCFNSIGLWFLQGVAGIVVDFVASPTVPITIRAGVDSGVSSATATGRAATEPCHAICATFA